MLNKLEAYDYSMCRVDGCDESCRGLSAQRSDETHIGRAYNGYYVDVAQRFVDKDCVRSEELLKRARELDVLNLTAIFGKTP